MKAYWINTPAQRIEEVEYAGDWRTIAPNWLACDLFTAVQINSQGDVVFVDDEGLINGNPHGWFTLRTYHQPLRGYGLVLGTDSRGESTAPSCSLRYLQEIVGFPLTVREEDVDRTIRVHPF